jgi:hypothetical protein
LGFLVFEFIILGMKETERFRRFRLRGAHYQDRLGLSRRAARSITERLYHVELASGTHENREFLRECLEIGSIMLYMNHSGFPDQFFVPAYLTNEFGDLIKRLGAPMSLKHYKFLQWREDWRNIIHGLVMRSAPPLFGIEGFPIPQHYGKSMFTKEEMETALEQFLSGSLEILSQPGGIVIIPPGGRFSPDGRLQKAQAGIGTLAKLCMREKKLGRMPTPVWAVPLAIIPPEGTIPVGEPNAGRHFFFGKKFGLNMGTPVPLEDVINLGKNGQEIADGLMEILAQLLPEERRGAYGCSS